VCTLIKQSLITDRVTAFLQLLMEVAPTQSVFPTKEN
jgi:hypothetical protein